MSFDTSALVHSFYIHWPFCPYRCHFCPFVAIAGQDEHMPAYHDALYTEIEQFIATQQQLVPLKTVFFGGGTPSTYPPELLEKTINLLSNKVGFEKGYELTIEVNPGTVTPEKLIAWKKIGINRLSIGVQSLNDAVLKNLNRHQKAAYVYSLLEQASVLFDNLSVDIIVGLPGVSVDDWKQMVNQIVTWPIKHVSLYFLTVHEDTQLYFGVQQKRIILPHDDEVVDLYYWTIDTFARAGIEQYEISNFAKSGWQSKHNTVYWERKPYKGFGLGACSFDGSRRIQNDKNLLRYMQGIRNTNSTPFFMETVSNSQAWLERLMLGLRQRKGVCVDDLLVSLTERERDEFVSNADLLSKNGLLEREDRYLRITPAGLSVANEVMVKLSCIDVTEK